MSVKRTDLIQYLEKNSGCVLKEGTHHTIYINDTKAVPIKGHEQFDRITANEICKQAGLEPKF